MIVNSLSTKDYAAFLPVIEALQPELGERFPISMQNWCGIGERPYPLKIWKVYIAYDVESNRAVGIYSFYQQENDPEGRFWIGWIGVVSSYRRKGIGAEFLAKVEQEVRELGARELWVHTDADNVGAMEFYKAFGMSSWGQFRNMGVQQASAEDDGAVFWKPLASTTTESL